ncbi:MAG: hypothetical protein K5882_04795 [Bacteroidales bacterium]|nr:hypothetical protein [Bacteroidales bacterium]
MSIIIVIAATALIFLILISCVKAPPIEAMIVSGLSRQPHVLIGKGGFRIPFFERIDKVFLGQTSADIMTTTLDGAVKGVSDQPWRAALAHLHHLSGGTCGRR